MAGRPIVQNRLRYKLAQAVLRVLYGRRWHYISPWQHGSVGAEGLFFHNGKLLLGRRAAWLEHPHKLSLVGGHLNFEDKEHVGEALVREAAEEAGLSLNAAEFPLERALRATLIHGKTYRELHDVSTIVFHFVHDLTDTEATAVRPCPEMPHWAFYSPAEVEQLIAAAEIASDTDIIQEAFRARR